MKRNERRLLEEKIRYIAMENIELDPEREQQMLEQAKATLMRQGAEQAEKRPAGHGMGRRVLIVSAAAVLVMVLSFGFTVLMPESVSHARGFMRTAAIWVNNTLHLGYEFEEPMENPAQQSLHDAIYGSLEEAAANIPYPLVYLDAPNFTLQSVTVQKTALLNEIVITYQDQAQSFVIKLEPAADSALVGFGSNAYTAIPWQCGELECWESNSTNYALTYYSNMEINIQCINTPYDDFVTLCKALKTFN